MVYKEIVWESVGRINRVMGGILWRILMKNLQKEVNLMTR
jgi:hypothetical protein